MNKELEEILQNYRTLFRKQIERIIVLIMEEEKEYLALNLPIDLNLQENLDITKRGEGKETAIEFSQDRNRYEHKVRANVSQEIEEYLKSRPKNLFFNKKDQNADNCVNELFHIISIITHEMRHAYQNELTKIRKDLVNVDALLWLKEQLAVTQDLISQNEKLMFREQDACKYMYRRALEYIEKYTNIKSSNTEVYNNIVSQVEEQERIISPIEEIMWITPEGEKRAVDYLNKIFAERANTIPEEIFKDSILRYEYNMDRTKKNLKQLLQDKKIMIDNLNKMDPNYANQIMQINNLYETIITRDINLQEKKVVPPAKKVVEKAPEKIEEKQQEPEKEIKKEKKVLIRESHEKDYFDYESGKNIKEIKEIFERKSGKYYIDTEIISKEKNYSFHSVMHVSNIETGKAEEAEYSRDNLENETYIYKIDNQIEQKIIKSNNEIIIENYKDRNVVATYKYDNSGKAIVPMENINQLPANFIENTFRKLIPYN